MHSQQKNFCIFSSVRVNIIKDTRTSTGAIQTGATNGFRNVVKYRLQTALRAGKMLERTEISLFLYKIHACPRRHHLLLSKESCPKDKNDKNTVSETRLTQWYVSQSTPFSWKMNPQGWRSCVKAAQEDALLLLHTAGDAHASSRSRMTTGIWSDKQIIQTQSQDQCSNSHKCDWADWPVVLSLESFFDLTPVQHESNQWMASTSRFWHNTDMSLHNKFLFTQEMCPFLVSAACSGKYNYCCGSKPLFFSAGDSV